MIRHGQSEANVLGFFAGWMDSPLTEIGMRQAELTALYIAENYTVDAVYSSDLSRAAAVGKAVSERTGAPLHMRKSLREICGGGWEGKTFTEIEEMYPAYLVWRSDIGNAVCDGGESVAQLQVRVVGAVVEIAENHPNQTVVITTHATPIRVTQCYCDGNGLSKMKDIPWVSNTSITELVYENGAFRIVSAGYDQHLGDHTSKLPANV